MTTSCTPRLLVTGFHTPGIASSDLLQRSADNFGYALELYPMLPVHKASYLQKVTLLQPVLAHECDDSVVMQLDTYDSFLAAPPHRTLQVLRESGTDVIFGVERLYSWQSTENKTFYERLKAASGSRSPYSYLNSGGFIGKVRALRPLVAAAAETPHSHWKGADQSAYSRLFAERLAEFNVSFDYDTRMFLVATADDWNPKTVHRRIASARPCVVHMPWRANPANNRTLVGLFEEFGHRHHNDSHSRQISRDEHAP